MAADDLAPLPPPPNGAPRSRLRVCFIASFCCARLIKMGWALRERGHHLTLLYRNVRFRQRLPFHRTYVYRGPRRLRSLLSRIRADAYHAGNEGLRHISWAAPAVPHLILDVHDLMAAHHGRSLPSERRAFRAASAFLFVSAPSRDQADRMYTLGPRPSKIVLTLPPSRWLPRQPLPRIGGIVYTGGVVGRHHPGRLRIRYLEEIWRSAGRQGIPFTVYGIHIGGRRPAHPVEGPLRPSRLLTQLTRHDWGFVGSDVRNANLMTALPNKLFEYLACGLPVVALNAGAASRFITRRGVGITIRHIGELAPAIAAADYAALKKNVALLAPRLTMDAQVPGIEAFYRQVMELSSKRTAKRRGRLLRRAVGRRSRLRRRAFARRPRLPRRPVRLRPSPQGRSRL